MKKEKYDLREFVKGIAEDVLNWEYDLNSLEEPSNIDSLLFNNGMPIKAKFKLFKW